MWYEHFRPAKLVAVDLAPASLSGYVDKYIASRGLHDRVSMYWKTDQTAAARLRTIVRDEFTAPLDLVIDDASHMYGPTKTTFETLFPLLRPGGLYVIEDWSWGCWPSLPANFSLSHGTELPKLISELVNAAGSMAPFLVGQGGTQVVQPLLAAVHVYPDFVVVERGNATLEAPERFTLEGYTTKRPALRPRESLAQLVKKIVR